MATPNINSQIVRDNLVSSLMPIIFVVSDTNSDTVNIVATVEYQNAGGVWTQWGGQIRMANRLNTTTVYELDISDLVAGLPKQNLPTAINSLGRGFKCSGGTYSIIAETKFNNISDWYVRVNFQREFKDALTGLITLDPDIATSNTFYVHQGSVLSELSRFGYRPSGSYSLAVYNHRFGCDFDEWDRGDKWLWMTDAPYQIRIPDVGEATETRPEYQFNITKDEQFYLSFINGALDTCCDATDETRLVIKTYGNIGSGTQLLNTHYHNYYNGPSNSGVVSVDVGWRTLLAALTPNANEGNAMGAAFNQVKHYYVYNQVCDGAGGRTKESLHVKFTIHAGCRTADGDYHTDSGPAEFTRANDRIAQGTRNAYQRFLWLSKAGTPDMCSSHGLLKEKKKFNNKLFNKRNPAGLFGRVGDNYYQTDAQTIYEVTTHEMDILEAKYMACIGQSVETYLRVEVTDPKYSVNTKSFVDIVKGEEWRDNSECNTYIPIVIISKSVNVYSTSENTAKVKFSYYFANKEHLPRN
tara:strand:+ start:2897 stop:4471 length:1575 start_codon:yes stop_codon:yes gene_type:complete